MVNDLLDRWGCRFSTLAVLVASLAMVARDAAAQTPVPGASPLASPGVAAKVSFLKTDELVLNFDQVAKQGGSFDVSVLNSGSSPEVVTIRLQLDSSVPAEDALTPTRIPVSASPVTAPVDAREVKQVPLTLEVARKPKLRPAPGSYRGSLILADSQGHIVQRPVTLRVDPEDVLPEGLASISLMGTNYVPSLLNPQQATVFWVGVGVALFFAALGVIILTDLGTKSFLRRKWGPFVAAFLFAVIVTFVCRILTNDGQDGHNPNLSNVIVESVQVSPQVGPDRLGAVSAPDGSTGTIRRGGNVLRVEGIPRAGSYEGTIDARPQEEGGEIKVTAVVKDFGIWTLATIAAGVLIGYLVTSYFKRDRPRQQVGMEAGRLWQQAVIDEQGFNDRFAGNPPANDQMLDLTQRWIKEAEVLADQDNFSDANARLEKLEEYEKDFARLRELLAKLAEERAKFQGAVSGSPLVGVPATLAAFAHATNILQTPIQTNQEDDKLTRLTQRKDAVESATRWVVNATRSFVEMGVDLQRVTSTLAMPDPNEEEKQQLRGVTPVWWTASS